MKVWSQSGTSQAKQYFSLALSLPVLILYIYYIELQTYVLKIDHFLSNVGVVFLGLQLLLAIISILYINSARGIRAL